MGRRGSARRLELAEYSSAGALQPAGCRKIISHWMPADCKLPMGMERRAARGVDAPETGQMPVISKLMIGFGAILLVCAPAGWVLHDWALRAAAVNGVAMIAAGAAAEQGRRSLRRTGLLVGFLLPGLMSIAFLWRAYELFAAPADADVPVIQPVLLLVLGIIALGALLLLIRARLAQTSLIAERGYSVTTPTHLVSPAATSTEQEQIDRR